MTRGELLRQIRGQLNRLAVELVNDDLLEPAQQAIAASMGAVECEGKLADAGEDDKTTEAAEEPAEGA